MRISLPSEQTNPLKNLVENYGSDLVDAGNRFGTAGYAHSRLSLREFEGARMRTAQINGCLICRDFRAERDVARVFGGVRPEGGVTDNGPAPDEAFYAAVESFRTSDLFSERERLAIEYAEGMGQNPHGIAEDESFWGRFKTAFSDAEIVDLTYCIAAWMGLGRVVHVLGLDAAACPIVPAAREAA